ncbi:MAG: hypothetical protein R2874_08760 [Desulfobacterales bacterium]
MTPPGIRKPFSSKPIKKALANFVFEFIKRIATALVEATSGMKRLCCLEAQTASDQVLSVIIV